jgi:hypothetical protein
LRDSGEQDHLLRVSLPAPEVHLRPKEKGGVQRPTNGDVTPFSEVTGWNRSLSAFASETGRPPGISAIADADPGAAMCHGTGLGKNARCEGNEEKKNQ